MFGNSFNKLIEEDQTPDWLKAGVTVLIPKTENQTILNLWPVCLKHTKPLHIYNKQDNVKVCWWQKADAWRTERVLQRIERMQRSSAVSTSDIAWIRTLSMAWMYYHKAFDRVSHSWIITSLELRGINNKITSFTKKATSFEEKICPCRQKRS